MIKWLSPWHPANLQQNENCSILTPTTLITSSLVLPFCAFDSDHLRHKLSLKNKHASKILLSKMPKSRQVKIWKLRILCTTDKGGEIQRTTVAQRKNRQRIKQAVQFTEGDSSSLKPYGKMLNLTNYAVKCKLNNKKVVLFLTYQFGKDYKIWQGYEEREILIYCWEYLAISINILNAHMLECSNPTSRNFSYR